MRITYIHQHFSLPTEPGGQRPWEFARRLAASGHDVNVLCGGARNETLTLEGVRVHKIAAHYENSMDIKQRIKSFVQFMAKSTTMAVRLEADVVFASSTPLTTAVPGIVTAMLRRKPFVFEVRDLWPSVPIELGILNNPIVIYGAKLLERMAYTAADHVIALSPGMAEGIKKVNPYVPVTVVPNASDISSFDALRSDRNEIRAEYGWRKDHVVLVYAGSFGATYDTQWMLETASHLRPLSNQYRVIICGKGADSERLRSRAKELDMDVESVLPGSLPKTEVMRLLTASDFAISTMIDAPPLYVNSLNKVFDALAAATPVIFNHAGWLPSLLENHEAGVRLPRNPQAAAEQLHSLLSSEYDRNQASANALKLGQDLFDRDDLYAKFKSVLELTTRNKRSVRQRLSLGVARGT